MTIDHDETSYEPPHATSPTDHVLNELQLHGYRPFQDEPDPRPMPEARTVAGAVADIFDALVATLSDTRLEPDLEDLLWSVRHQQVEGAKLEIAAEDVPDAVSFSIIDGDLSVLFVS